MTDMTRDELIDHLAADDMRLLDKLLADGHTIFAPSHYTKHGFDMRLITPVCREHKSNFDDPKYTISVGEGLGEPVRSLAGIYNLEFLWHIALTLDAKVEPCLGRGSQARKIVEGIRNTIKEALNNG